MHGQHLAQEHYVSLSNSICAGASQVAEECNMSPKALSKKLAEEGVQGPSKKLKTQRDPATTAKGEFVTFLNRVKAGSYRKRASAEDKQEADETLQHYNSLAQEQKAAFAMAYTGNKDKKTFAWARDFMQTVKVTKEDQQESTAKYMTRSSYLIFF